MTSFLALLRATIGFNPVLWLRSRRQMDRRIAEFLPHVVSQDDGHEGSPDTLVVITPWLGTIVPWFTLAIGLMMARRGAHVRFVIDDLPYSGNPLRHAFISRIIRSVMKRVGRRFEVLYLDRFSSGALDEADLAAIDYTARLNATWALKGEMVQDGRAAKIERERRQNAVAQASIIGLFSAIDRPALLFTPGGVFGHSSLWLREAKKRSIRIATFDAGGFDTMVMAANGIACQLQDTPLAYAQLREDWKDDPADRQAALRRAEEQIAKRRTGKDVFASQAVASGAGGAGLDGGFLIALNSSWDAAALGLHRAFDTNTEWIVGTVRYLLENTDRPVIVRQHPAERLAFAATSEDYDLMLRREFGRHERLHFIAASDPINSYALMERVAAVVVHTSTVGMEAAAFGVPVITGSASYYAEQNFVNFGENKARYEDMLQQAAQGQLEVSDDMKTEAMLFFYLAQVCSWVFSSFSPTSYNTWIARPLMHWAEQPAVQAMIDALITGTPVATINHRAQRA